MPLICSYLTFILHPVNPLLLYLAKTLTSLQSHAKYVVCSGVCHTMANTYTSSQKHYMDFCIQYGFSTMPTDEETLLLYVAYLDCSKLHPGSIRVYLEAVRSLQIEEGWGNPLEGTLQLSRAVRALKITGEAVRQSCQ